MTTTTLRRRKGGLYGIQGPPPVPMFYAFINPDTPDELRACIYSSVGEWVEDRASVIPGASVPGAGGTTIIAADSAANVGVGALAWQSDVAQITVWDVEGDVVYTHDAALGTMLSPPVYRDGWLYWHEAPAGWTASTATTWIRKARTDLTDVQTVATITDVTTGLAAATFDEDFRIVAQQDHLLSRIGYQDAEVTGGFYVRCEWGGGAYTSDFNGADVGGVGVLGLRYGFNDGGGTAVGFADGESQIKACADSLTAPALDRWPETGGWALESTTFYGLSVSQDMAWACLVGDGAASSRVAVVSSPLDTSGSPDHRIEIADYPDTAFKPGLVFLME